MTTTVGDEEVCSGGIWEGEERRNGRGWVLSRSVHQEPLGSAGSQVRPLVPTVRAWLKSWPAQGVGPDRIGMVAGWRSNRSGF